MPVYFIGRMQFNRFKNIRLYITGGTNLEVYVFFNQVIKQGCIFRTADTMPDPGGMKMPEYFPYTLRTLGFTSMTGTGAVSYTHLDVYKRQPLGIQGILFPGIDAPETQTGKR